MKQWKYKTPGIPDDLFIRGDVPMTKAEVRAVVISKLRLKADHIVYDIGAGTGSISIEAGHQAQAGTIFAVERKEEGINLIKRNVEKFKLENIKIIKGEAPQALDKLLVPDRVIIGGSGGQLQAIIDKVDQKMKPGGRIVITAVTINTLNSAISILENREYNLDICNIAVTRTREVADYHMFKALNPIYIISAGKEN